LLLFLFCFLVAFFIAILRVLHRLIEQVPRQASQASNPTGIYNMHSNCIDLHITRYVRTKDSYQDAGASQMSFMVDFSINDIQLDDLDAPAKFELKAGPAQRNTADNEVNGDNENGDNDDDDDNATAMKCACWPTSTVPLRAPSEPRPPPHSLSAFLHAHLQSEHGQSRCPLCLCRPTDWAAQRSHQ
jgi:hypothetical protein